MDGDRSNNLLYQQHLTQSDLDLFPLRFGVNIFVLFLNLWFLVFICSPNHRIGSKHESLLHVVCERGTREVTGANQYLNVALPST